MEKLKRYIDEANLHIEAINEAYEEIKNIELNTQTFQKLNKLQKFSYEIIVFRFSKLQDLLGSKLFRAYLDFLGFVTQDLSYYDLLKELENEGILDIDRWAILRKVRNQISHEYPQEDIEKMEKINLVLKEVFYLIEIVKKIERKYYEINKR